MNSFAVTSRDIQRGFAAIIERVKQTKQPAILMSKKEAQAVIVSLEDYEQLQELRRRNSARALRNLAKDVHELLKDEQLPHDLSTRHDYYLWEEEAQSA